VQGTEFGGFEWDADKSERCLAERGFDFEYVTKIFGGDFIEWPDRRRDYGEERFVTVGTVDGRDFAVVWTPRKSTRRIISARPAARSEREQLHGHRETQ
jgi:uncharacterized DUF497 family protein